MKINQYDIIVIGGGAASFFFCANLERAWSSKKVLILEQSKNILSKVSVSGGGRCNVTNAITDPNELIKYYPRGGRELLGPFHKFNCSHSYHWFENRGVSLKIEDDGRVFPVSNKSEDIINLLEKETKRNNINILRESKVIDFFFQNNIWIIKTNKEVFETQYLVIGSGSSKFIWDKLKQLTVDIVHSVPSLFTFKMKEKLLMGLEGIAVELVEVTIKDTKIQQNGPILITHEGLSGPAILKCSAFGARLLAQKEYRFTIEVNWLPMEDGEIIQKLMKINGKKNLVNGFTHLPNRLWERMIHLANVNPLKKWAELSKHDIKNLSQQLFMSNYEINGKSTFKDEFVTAGGVALNEVNFKNFALKKYPNLYCIGEMLDIDAVTGGFNFQACWTGAYLAATDINQKLHYNQKS